MFESGLMFNGCRIETQLRADNPCTYRALQVESNVPCVVRLIPETRLVNQTLKDHVRSLLALKGSHIPVIVSPMIVGGTQHEGGNRYAYMIRAFVTGQPLYESFPPGSNVDLDLMSSVSHSLFECLHQASIEALSLRNLSPSNVFLTPTGDVRITDQGASLKSSRSNLTPPYHRPATLGVEFHDKVEDMYAIGMMILEILTGPYPETAWSETERQHLVRERLENLRTCGLWNVFSWISLCLGQDTTTCDPTPSEILDRFFGTSSHSSEISSGARDNRGSGEAFKPLEEISGEWSRTWRNEVLGMTLTTPSPDLPRTSSPRRTFLKILGWMLVWVTGLAAAMAGQIYLMPQESRQKRRIRRKRSIASKQPTPNLSVTPGGVSESEP